MACPVCLCEVETCLHLARGCGWVMGLWEGLELRVKSTLGFERVREWVEAVLSELDESEAECFVKGVWAVWEVRNGVVFEGKDIHVSRVVRRVRELLKEMEEVETAEMEKRESNPSSEPRQNANSDGGWRRPSLGSIKINVDAGVKEGEGMGIGVVCRDDRGAVKWGWAERRREELEARVAEAMLAGLKLAHRMKIREVYLEGDCKEVIEALQHRQSGRTDFHAVLEEIYSFCRNFSSVCWSFRSRKSNTVAHELAHFCKVGESLFFNDSTIPSRVIDLAAADLIERL